MLESAHFLYQQTQVAKSAECSYSGSLACGVCACDPGYFGDVCQCSSATLDHTSHVAQCIKSVNAIL